VLVTAFTHTGINNALQKINKVTGYPHTVKMGKSHQLDGLNYDDATVKLDSYKRSQSSITLNSLQKLCEGVMFDKLKMEILKCFNDQKQNNVES
jgi:hypothetical protein